MLKDTSKISLFEKLIYGSGAFGMNALYTLFSTYVLFFYIKPIMVTCLNEL